MKRQEKVNSSKYRKHTNIEVGDVVLVRDCSRRSKFDPIFLPDPFVVTQRNDESKSVLLKGLNHSKILLRHVDDVKDITYSPDSETVPMIVERNMSHFSNAELIAQEALVDENSYSSNDIIEMPNGDGGTNDIELPRRSGRMRKIRKRYIEEI